MDNTKRIIETLFASNDKIAYGFTILQNFYANICSTPIIDSNTKRKTYPLLSSLNDSINDVFNHIDLNYLCDDFHWLLLTKHILSSADSMSNNEKKAEIRSLLALNSLIGKK